MTSRNNELPDDLPEEQISAESPDQSDQQTNSSNVQELTHHKVRKLLEEQELTSSQLGATFSKLGDYERAFHHYTQALEEDPSDPITLDWLGQYHLRKMNYEQAISYFQKAIDLGYNKSHNNLGMTFYMMGKKEKAMEHLRQVNVPRTMFNVGYIMLNEGLYQEADETFRKAIENGLSGQPLAQAFYMAGCANLHLGKKEEADEFMKNAAVTGDGRAYAYLAERALENGDMNAAKLLVIRANELGAECELIIESRKKNPLN